MNVLPRILRFLVDESGDARVADHLRTLGFDATTVAGDYRPGLRDDEVLALAHSEGRILITDDRHFGDLVVRHGHLHVGVILLRLDTTTLPVRLARIDYVLEHYADRLDRFLVVTRDRVRVYPPPE